LSPGAEKMLQVMQAAGIKTMVISGGFTFFTERIKQHLGLDYAFANTLDIENGRLTGRVLRIRDQLGLSREQVIAIGDGANDLRMLDAAGIGIAFHAKPVLRKHATYCLDHVGLDGVLNLFE